MFLMPGICKSASLVYPETMKPDTTRDEGLRELAVHERLRGIICFPNGHRRNHSEALVLLEEYKKELRKEKKRFARELHPDANVSEDINVIDLKSKRLQTIMRAIDFVMGLRIPTPIARPQVFITFHNQGFNSTTVSSSTTTATATGMWNSIVR